MFSVYKFILICLSNLSNLSRINFNNHLSLIKAENYPQFKIRSSLKFLKI